MGARQPLRYLLPHHVVSTRAVTNQMESADALSRLGLHPGASEAAIRRAFRALCRANHPDVNPHPSATDDMRAINLAYRRALAAARGAPDEPFTGVRARRWAPSRVDPTRWRRSNPGPRENSPRATAVHFGFIDRDQTAVRSIEISARSASSETRIRAGADWIHVSPERVIGTAVVQITADPRRLSGFWDGRTRESAMIESWIDLEQDVGMTRVIVRAILRRLPLGESGRSS